MGGPGSGDWYRWNKRDTTDEHRGLDIRVWHRKGLLRPGSWFSWCWWRNGKEVANIDVRVERRTLVTLSYRYRAGDSEWQDVNEPVPIEWTPCYYGGERPWFRCPGVVSGRHCNRRVAILYGAGRYFLCRHCHRLVYVCQRENHMTRALSRAQKIRARLGGSARMTQPFPPKPKRMRWRTYERLWEAHDKTDRESWAAVAEWLERTDRRIERLARR